MQIHRGSSTRVRAGNWLLQVGQEWRALGLKGVVPRRRLAFFTMSTD